MSAPREPAIDAPPGGEATNGLPDSVPLGHVPPALAIGMAAVEAERVAYWLESAERISDQARWELQASWWHLRRLRGALQRAVARMDAPPDGRAPAARRPVGPQRGVSAASGDDRPRTLPGYGSERDRGQNSPPTRGISQLPARPERQGGQP